VSTLAPMWRWARVDWSWALDGALALVFFGLAVLELTRPLEEMHQRAPLGVDVALQAVFCASLVLRTHYPRATVVVMSAVLLVPSLLPQPATTTDTTPTRRTAKRAVSRVLLIKPASDPRDDWTPAKILIPATMRKAHDSDPEPNRSLYFLK